MTSLLKLNLDTLKEGANNFFNLYIFKTYNLILRLRLIYKIKFEIFIRIYINIVIGICILCRKLGFKFDFVIEVKIKLMF